MKKTFVILIFLSIIFFSPYLFAQTAKIVDVKGEVLVKKNVSLSWQRAEVNMVLEKEAELKTKKNSECTLTFDDELNNLLTIKENSYIKLDNIKPARILLPEGRVFSLIEDIAGPNEFQIRTPTAVAGVRGTGWSVGAKKQGAEVFCFEDKVFAQGLDKQGNITGNKDVIAGFGLTIALGGKLGGIFKLGSEDFDGWNKFRGFIEGIRGSGEEVASLAKELRETLSEVFGTETGFAAVSEFGVPLVGEITFPTQISDLSRDITLTEPPPSLPGSPPEIETPREGPPGPFRRVPVSAGDILEPGEISKPNKPNAVATCATCD